MRTRKVQCPVCGTHNWSGSEYCQKCSGALYHSNDEEDIVLTKNLYAHY